MKVIIDTNIALYVLLNRVEFFQTSHDILKLSALDKIAGFITTNAVADMFYMLHKNSRDALKSKESLSRLLKLATLEAVIPRDIYFAFTSDIIDFEDAVMCSVAKRIKARYIVTRNTKDFKGSPVPAIEPVDFLSKYFPVELK